MPLDGGFLRVDETAELLPLCFVLMPFGKKMDAAGRVTNFDSVYAVLMLAGYYCFDAGAIAAFLPPERREAITLQDFGETVVCKDVGRTP